MEESCPFEHDSTETGQIFAKKYRNQVLNKNLAQIPSISPKYKKINKKRRECCLSAGSTVLKKSLVLSEQDPQKCGKIENTKQSNISLAKLGDWIRYTSSTLKLSKSYYNRAITLLKQAVRAHSSSYPVAAAALIIIVKFQHSSLLKRITQLPIGKSNPKHPIIKLCEAYQYELQVLKASKFNVPQDDLSPVMMEVCQKWTLYLRRNSRHMKIPLKYLQTGYKNEWQRRNLYSVAFLIDVIIVSAKMAEFPQDISEQHRTNNMQIVIVACAILLAGAANSCTLDKLNSRQYGILSFIRCFLKKCFKFTQESLLPLQDLITQCVSKKICKKLKHLPCHIQYQSSEDFMNKLEYISMFSDDQNE